MSEFTPIAFTNGTRTETAYAPREAVRLRALGWHEVSPVVGAGEETEGEGSAPADSSSEVADDPETAPVPVPELHPDGDHVVTTDEVPIDLRRGRRVR